MMAFAAAELTFAEFWPRNCIKPGQDTDEIENTIENVRRRFFIYKKVCKQVFFGVTAHITLRLVDTFI